MNPSKKLLSVCTELAAWVRQMQIGIPPCLLAAEAAIAQVRQEQQPTTKETTMPEINTAVKFEIYCSCGARLCNLADVKYPRNGNPRIIVDACPACLDRAGYKEGYDKGYEEGYSCGWIDSAEGKSAK